MGVRVISGKAQLGASHSSRPPSSGSRSKRTPTVGRGIEDEKYAQIEQALATFSRRGPMIAVLVPVLSRPHRVEPLLASFRAATSPDDAFLYFVAQRSDTAELDAIRAAGVEPILVDDADRSWARKINRGMESTSEPWLLLGADDLAFRTGWVGAVSDLLSSYGGVIGTNDLGNASTIRGTSSTHPLVRRAYAEIFGTADELGKITHEGYDHNFPDSELIETAKARGLYVHRRDCVIEHLHPLWGKGQADPIYQRGQMNWHADQALFVSRCRKFGIGGA